MCCPRSFTSQEINSKIMSDHVDSITDSFTGGAAPQPLHGSSESAPPDASPGGYEHGLCLVWCGHAYDVWYW